MCDWAEKKSRELLIAWWGTEEDTVNAIAVALRNAKDDGIEAAARNRDA